MTTFNDLLQTYRSSPEELLKQVEGLDPQTRHDLLVENVEGRLQMNRVEDEDSIAQLPREYRRQAGVRWDHFGYVLHYFERPMLERHLRGHLEVEAEDPKANYTRKMLAMLVWMSTSQENSEAVEQVAPARGHRRG